MRPHNLRNFRELRHGEVRRINLLGTWVNRGLGAPTSLSTASITFWPSDVLRGALLGIIGVAWVFRRR